ncbi:hypothetical protein BDV95DRAFT_587336 [Massariosphaeria phaeospora]|uniref:Uncharacterized protein n=1 Tax=Massariosphaeria phaeospora TaxID=100035 RepID=A0A7C8I122_9PLEO|nr:hypothetical protein BDV95DRAFT_587336 [Massariosphaeria phaeospora]
MAALFRDFSFEPASRLPLSVHEAERVAMNVSPTSPPPFAPPRRHARLPTPPPCPVGELAQRMTLHLEIDPQYQVASAYEPLTPPSDDICFHTEALERCQPPFYSHISSAIVRMQRQATTRKQTSPSHMKDLAALVEKMIEDEEQCNICDSKSRTPSTSSASDMDGDEGIDMDCTPSTDASFRHPVPLHRSTDRSTGYSFVSKKPRMRKQVRAMKRSPK